MAHLPKLALVGLALWAVAAPSASASDLPYSRGYVLEDGDDDFAPRFDRRVASDEEVAPRVQRRIVERHVIERYVEEPVEREVVRRRVAEPVLAPPLPIGPVDRWETRVRVQPVAPGPVLRPLEERGYARPVVDHGYALPVQERRMVRAAPPVEACRTLVDRRIDRFGYEEVTRTRICD
jgi:hypothetical protein